MGDYGAQELCENCEQIANKPPVAKPAMLERPIRDATPRCANCNQILRCPTELSRCICDACQQRIREANPKCQRCEKPLETDTGILWTLCDTCRPGTTSDVYHRPIQHHGGKKYLRKIHPADGQGEPILVDVYCVIEAWAVSCPGLQHALKKVLACGSRGKGSKVDDIKGILDATWRALELQEQREKEQASGKASNP